MAAPTTTDPPADADVVDADVVDDMQQRSTELVHAGQQPGAALAVTPQVTAADLVARLDIIRHAADQAMQQDVDYGRVPGTDKPTLFKPGAEKLSVLFQLDVQLANEKRWGPDDHLTVVSHATVYHAPTGARLGYGEGVCTTRERKYAYRRAERTCPECGKPAVIKGKQEYGGGWLCFKKKDGCGAKWPDGTAAIEAQATGDVPNPDLPDLWNTVVKMAEKRARVDAVLAVTGASALFTQDIEDAPHHEPPAAPVASNGNGYGHAPDGLDGWTLPGPQAIFAERLIKAAIDSGVEVDRQKLQNRLNGQSTDTVRRVLADIQEQIKAARAAQQPQETLDGIDQDAARKARERYVADPDWRAQVHPLLSQRLDLEADADTDHKAEVAQVNALLEGLGVPAGWEPPLSQNGEVKA